MADAWGGSWGGAWGSSWGAGVVVVAPAERRARGGRRQFRLVDAPPDPPRPEPLADRLRRQLFPPPPPPAPPAPQPIGDVFTTLAAADARLARLRADDEAILLSL